MNGKRLHAAVGFLLVLCLCDARSQGAEPAVPVPAPAGASEKLRAFTGDWMNDKVVVGLTKRGVAPLTPAYEKKLEALEKLAVAGEEVPGNEPQCIPNGPVMDSAFGFKVFADAVRMIMLSSGPRVRTIWVDGRPHTADELLFPTYGGDSVAHWDVDTLVIDTVGLMPSNEIVFGIAVGDDKMHLIERWRLLSPGKLHVQTTVESAAALTRPWTYVRTYSRVPASAELQYCVPASDRARDGQFDLTPPSGGYVPPGADK
jgi:hypothetical protein